MKTLKIFNILFFLFLLQSLCCTTASVIEIKIKPISINPVDNSVLCKTLYIPNYEGVVSILEAYFGILIITQDGIIHEQETYYYSFDNWYNYKKDESEIVIQKLLKDFEEGDKIITDDQGEVEEFLRRNNFNKQIPIKKYKTKIVSLDYLKNNYKIYNQKTLRNFNATKYYGNDIEIIFQLQNILIIHNYVNLFIYNFKKSGATFNIPNWFFDKEKIINRGFDIHNIDGILIKK